MFMPFDRVSYIGSKFAKELHGKLGEVVAHVRNEPKVLIVDFGSDAFICHEKNLTSFRPTKEQENKEQMAHGAKQPVEIQRRKRTRAEEEI